MKLSIIIPVYNEQQTIREIINRLQKVKLGKVQKELVVVDDFSTDQSRRLLHSLAKKIPGLKLILHSANRGKGAAVRTGLRQAKGDIFLIQDADLEYDPNDIPRLLAPVLAQKAEVVYGSRFTGERKNMFFWHMVGNKLLSLATNVLYNTTLSDMEVCYKLFTRKAFAGVELKEDRWGFDPEITTAFLNKGLRIYEVPISYSGREFQEGKKISWKDGFRIVWVLLKNKFRK